MAKFVVAGLQNGSEVKLIYDTKTNVICNLQGQDLLKDYKVKKEYPPTQNFTRTYNPYRKQKENSLLEISLGSNCNFKCKYCSQNLLKNKAYSGTPVDAYLLIDKLKKSKLQPMQIQLWGGEPLVYWKTILVLLPRLRAMYENAHISIITNGSLLDREKVDFLVKYRCDLSLSHDGPGNQFRYKDVLKSEKVVDALRYAIEQLGKHFSINVTPAQGNTDVLKIAEFFNTFFDIKDNSLILGVHNIVRCHDSRDPDQVDACTISDEDLKTYSDTIFEALNTPDKNSYGFNSLEYKVHCAIEGILFEEPIDSVLAECDLPFSNGLLIDMRGNVLTCHNHAMQSYTCGNLENLSEVNAIGYNCWKNKERCRNCPFIHWCKGGCPSADDKANELACRNLYALYYAILRVVFARLLGVYVLSIEEMQDEVHNECR